MMYRWERSNSIWANLVSFSLVEDGRPDAIWGKVVMLRDGAGWTVSVPPDMDGVVYDTAEQAELAVEREQGLAPWEVAR